MLDYLHGQHRLSYSTSKYDFESLVLDALLVSNETEIPLQQVHQLDGIVNNVEKYRQILFSLFRTQEFQLPYKKLGAHLIDTYFNESALIQKTPTVRIQLPGADSTSYHSDGWYGHCLLYTSPSPRDATLSRMPSSA